MNELSQEFLDFLNGYSQNRKSRFEKSELVKDKKKLEGALGMTKETNVNIHIVVFTDQSKRQGETVGIEKLYDYENNNLPLLINANTLLDKTIDDNNLRTKLEGLFIRQVDTHRHHQNSEDTNIIVQYNMRPHKQDPGIEWLPSCLGFSSIIRAINSLWLDQGFTRQLNNRNYKMNKFYLYIDTWLSMTEGEFQKQEGSDLYMNSYMQIVLLNKLYQRRELLLRVLFKDCAMDLNINVEDNSLQLDNTYIMTSEQEIEQSVDFYDPLHALYLQMRAWWDKMTK